MSIFYDDIKPWGRSFDEYLLMFNLNLCDRNQKIIGCGDGPASFNAGMKKRGFFMVSVDPIYAYSKVQIEQRIYETFDEVMLQTKNNLEKFNWNQIGSPEELGRRRMAAMKEFLNDFEIGLSEGRYIAGELPHLSFPDKCFDLALCSHLLFLYTENLTFDFHYQSVKEMMRVADEARIFPILDANSNISLHLEPLIMKLLDEGYKTEILTVDYEFQKGGNTCLFVQEGMFPEEEIAIMRAEKSDLKKILNIQKLAFLTEVKLHNQFVIQPMRQTFEEIIEEFDQKIFFKALSGNEIIGSVRANQDGNICWINKLVVHPKYHNRGIAKKLMKAVEDEFSPHVEKFMLATSLKSERNHYFYNKIGYQMTKSGFIPEEKVEMVFFEKMVSYDNT